MPSNEGKAYIAGWIIKLVAGVALMAALGWANGVNTAQQAQEVKIAQQEVERKNLKEQLDRIERSVDQLKAALMKPQGGK